MGHLTKVLEALQNQQLVVNKRKCVFNQRKLEYLGHSIFEDGVAVELKNIHHLIE